MPSVASTVPRSSHRVAVNRSPRRRSYRWCVVVGNGTDLAGGRPSCSVARVVSARGEGAGTDSVGPMLPLDRCVSACLVSKVLCSCTALAGGGVRAQMDEIKLAKLKKRTNKRPPRRAKPVEEKPKEDTVASLLDLRREEMGYEDEEAEDDDSSSDWDEDE